MLMLPALMPASTAAEISPFSFAPPPPSSNLFLSCSSKLPKCTRAFFSGGSSEDIAFADRCKPSHSQSLEWNLDPSIGRPARTARRPEQCAWCHRDCVTCWWALNEVLNRKLTVQICEAIVTQRKEREREKEIMPTEGEGEGEGRDFGKFCIFISRSCGVFSSISKRTLYCACDHKPTKQISYVTCLICEKGQYL